MSNSSKCKVNLNFRAHYGPAEKNQPKVQELLRKSIKSQKLLRKIKKELRLSALASQQWLLSQQSSLLQGKQQWWNGQSIALVSMKFHSKKSPSPIQSISRLDNHNFKHFLGQKYYCLAKFVQSEPSRMSYLDHLYSIQQIFKILL